MTPPPHVLMVDDNLFDVELTREALVELGFGGSFATVSNGLEALAYLRGEPPFAGQPRPSLVLLDLNMPRLDGRSTLARIKADGLLCDIPVVILSTSESECDVLDCYRGHAAAFVTKPVTMDDLIDKLRVVCQLWLGGVAALPHRRPGQAGSGEAPP